MKINEAQIEKILVKFDDDNCDLEKLMKELAGEHELLIAYLLSDNFSLLSEEETDYFQYLSLVAIDCCHNFLKDGIHYNQEDIDHAEENNWKMMEEQGAKAFNEKITVFFESSEEEDLLAFIEDSLTPEDGDFVTPVGRDLMCVGLKTMVDVLCNEAA